MGLIEYLGTWAKVRSITTLTTWATTFVQKTGCEDIWQMQLVTGVVFIC